ncbi:MAG: hypothetical protein AAB649_05225, partial [Patescibacteria group bacterium]
KFITKHYSGHPESKSISIDAAAGSITTKDSQAIVDVVPFVVQYNGKSHSQSIDNPLPPILTQHKFYLASTNFIQQRNSGNPKSKVASVDEPARTITGTGGNLDLVDVEQVLPFAANMENENGKDATQHPFIMRYFSSGGGQLNDINGPAGGMTTVPKMHLVSPEEVHYVMNPSYNNVGTGIDEPMHTLLGSRKHPYLMSHQFNNPGNGVDKPAPTVIASQDKKPMHLVQIVEGDVSYLGIAIYKSDSPSLRELKYFMAANNIKDIRMRMLKVRELLSIQGFPANYVLKG